MKSDKSCGVSGCGKLSVCNFAMALGIVWGLSMFLCALLSMTNGMAMPIVEVFSSIYLGFEPSFLGALMGLFWGFIDGFVFGGLLAFFYNYCSCKCPCTYCKKNRKGH